MDVIWTKWRYRLGLIIGINNIDILGIIIDCRQNVDKYLC